jgi:hypothetical protein
LFSVITHFLEDCEEKDFSLTAIVDEDFGDIPSIDVNGDNHDVGVWERSDVDILGRECYGYVGSLGLGNGVFNGNMIDLPRIVSTLPLSIKIGVRASGDCKDYAVGRETIGLLRRLTDL